MMFMKGMFIKGRSDLIAMQRYDGNLLFDAMKNEISGKIKQIMYYTYENGKEFVQFETGGYYYSPEMFEPVETNLKKNL